MPVRRFKGAKAKADKLFSEVVRSLGYCEAEDWDEEVLGGTSLKCSAQLQTAHICSRRFSATRTDLRNAFCLCFSHHRYFTDYPRQFSRFITTTWAQKWYDEIFAASLIPTKVDWTERVVYLTDIQKRINSGEITLQQAREL